MGRGDGGPTGAVVGPEWVAALPPQLYRQAGLLGALVTAVESDPRWEALELGCSVAEGRADEWSDLDVGLWFGSLGRPDDHVVDTMVGSLGDVVEINAQPWDGVSRWWVQYADGAQLDLVVAAAAERGGRAPGGVVLMDRTGRFAAEFTPSVLRAGPDEPRRWFLDGWEALSNVVKYLHRGSLLEAAEQMHRVRTRVCQLWAAGHDVDYPSFGLTSLLDGPVGPPPGIESTYTAVDHESMVTAARHLAALMVTSAVAVSSDLGSPLVQYVRARLDALSSPPLAPSG